MGWCRNGVLFAIAALSVGSAPAGAVRLSYDIAGIMQYEDNLFRLPKAMAGALPHGGGDRIAAVSGSMAIDGGSGDLSFGAKASGQQSWFAHNGYLDNFGYSATAHARYAGQRGSIAIEGGWRHRLTAFEDIRGTARNFQTLASGSTDATMAIGADIRAIGRADIVRSTNSLAAISPNDYRRIGAAAGLGLYSPAGNILSLEGKIETSHGLNDSGTVGGAPYRSSYVERSIVTRLYWQPSVMWQIDARLGYSWHDDRSVVALDFSGLTGDATVTWSPARAIQIALRGARLYESNSAIFSNGIRNSEIDALFKADITDRANIRVNLRRAWRLFRYDSQAIVPLTLRSEVLTRAAVSLGYRVGPAIVTLTGAHERRDSPQPDYRFRANVIDLSVSLPFGAAGTGDNPTTAF